MPVFFISNVTSHNLSSLKKFLNVLPFQEPVQSSNEERAEFIAYNKFLLDEKLVLTGFVYKGTIRKHQKLYLGPLLDGSFEFANKNRFCARDPVLQDLSNGRERGAVVLRRRKSEGQERRAEAL